MFRIAAALTITLSASVAVADDFVSLFNGKDLDGWVGDEKMWSVKEGAIVGKHEGLKGANTFLRTKDKYDNFVLKISFVLVDGKGNSGVQYRSSVVEKGVPHAFVIKGYQADIDNGGFVGCLYEERGRGVLAHPNPATKGKFKAVEGAWEKLKATLKPNEWNTYVITCDGDKVTQELNGVVTVDIVDPDGAKEGVIALQLHVGGPMEIKFKDIQIKKIAKK